MTVGKGLLAGEDEAAATMNPDGSSEVVLVCEHAGKRIPRRLGSLGLPQSEIERHIGWDIGAEGTARRLAELLDAPLVLQRYSRLVYDCNRPPESPGAIPLLSETTRIPGNENITAAERLSRIEAIYRPFHDAVSRLIDRRTAAGRRTILVAIHSFTPVFKGARRHIDLGLLHDRDSRLADLLLAHSARERDLVVRRNEPYGPEDGVCHTISLHGDVRGLLNVMIEIRHDHIAEEEGQSRWAERLSDMLARAISRHARLAAS
jgi:predicted N-formylglutamate amidohydrolase